MTRVRASLLTLWLIVLLRLPLTLMVQRLLPAGAPEATYGASMAMSLLLFALPGGLLKLKWEKTPIKPREGLGWLLLSVGAALTARAVATPLNAWWAQWIGAETTAFPMETGAAWLLMALALAIVPAVAEELFFRGALLPNLLRGGSVLWAAAVTTLSFALMHGSLAGLPGHLLISLLLTMLMLHSGRVIVPITVHAVYNLSALIWPETSLWVPVLCGLLLTGLLVYLLVRMPRGQERRCGPADMLLAMAALLMLGAQYLL